MQFESGNCGERRRKGAFNATLDSLRRPIANAGMSVEQAMNVLEIPASDRPRYLAAMG